MGDAAAIEARVLADRGPEEGGMIVALAKAFMAAPPAPPRAAEAKPESGPRATLAREIAVSAADARKAGGTPSVAVNAMIIRQAVTGLDDAAAREMIALLGELAQRRDLAEGGAACARDLTFGPVFEPERSLPCFYSCITFFTFRCCFVGRLAIMLLPSFQNPNQIFRGHHFHRPPLRSSRSST
jgi:hypothetical protein